MKKISCIDCCEVFIRGFVIGIICSHQHGSIPFIITNYSKYFSSSFLQYIMYSVLVVQIIESVLLEFSKEPTILSFSL